jgi:hypothetical protein
MPLENSFSLLYFDACDIPGGELSNLGIHIKYLRSPKDGTVENTLAWRRCGSRVYFGISRYNSNDRILERVQPCKAIGRREAIRYLYDAEKTLYDNKANFALEKNGVAGCCDEHNLDVMHFWFESRNYENWRNEE